jgi:hypothetical protein
MHCSEEWESVITWLRLTVRDSSILNLIVPKSDTLIYNESKTAHILPELASVFVKYNLIYSFILPWAVTDYNYRFHNRSFYAMKLNNHTVYLTEYYKRFVFTVFMSLIKSNSFCAHKNDMGDEGTINQTHLKKWIVHEYSKYIYIITCWQKYEVQTIYI